MSALFEKFRVIEKWLFTGFVVRFYPNLPLPIGKTEHTDIDAMFIRDEQKKFIEDAICEKLEREREKP